MEPKERIILSLDSVGRQRARVLVEQTSDLVGAFKIGLTALLREGYGFLDPIRKPIFLDLRLANDATTVATIIAEIGAKAHRITLSPFVGPTAITAAVRVAHQGAEILICTPLTVLSDSDIRILKQTPESLRKSTIQTARYALNMGVTGIVCDPGELQNLRAELGDKPCLVTTELNSYSSVSIHSPQIAMKHGADFVMVDQIVTASPDPSNTLKVFTDLLKAGFALRSSVPATQAGSDNFESHGIWTTGTPAPQKPKSKMEITKVSSSKPPLTVPDDSLEERHITG